MNTAYKNVKVGDKMYCKKTLRTIDKDVYYIKNKTYEVTCINNILVNLNSEMNIDISFNTFIPNANEFKIYEYFYTEQEHRKQKLIKISTAK